MLTEGHDPARTLYDSFAHCFQCSVGSLSESHHITSHTPTGNGLDGLLIVSWLHCQLPNNESMIKACNSDSLMISCDWPLREIFNM